MLSNSIFRDIISDFRGFLRKIGCIRFIFWLLVKIWYFYWGSFVINSEDFRETIQMITLIYLTIIQREYLIQKLKK